MRLIFDTDIGDDIDDAFALALLLRLPQVQLEGVTVVHGAVEGRARLALKLLAVAGRPEVPVCVGDVGKGDPNRALSYGGWAADWVETRPAQGDAVSFLVRRILEGAPGAFTVLAVGPLTNIALALRQEPRLAERIGALVVMGGALRVGYQPESPPCAECNIACDPASAQVVFRSGARLFLVPLDATRMLQPRPQQLAALAASPLPLARSLHQCLEMWARGVPTLFDPMAVACALTRDFVTTERVHVQVTDDGGTVESRDQPPNAEVATGARADDFLDWYFRALLGASA